MKGLSNFCAVILINLVVDIHGGIFPIQSGPFLRTASLFTTVNRGRHVGSVCLPHPHHGRGWDHGWTPDPAQANQIL